ncbi:MAG TPA: flagellin [Caulobacteraceae bacterium]|jgi:flagellin
MGMNSVNTNIGAMVALQNLNATNNELATVQSRINTGRKINSARDNGAIWAIAQSQRSESTALNAVKESLQRGQSTIDVAMAAGESISDLLIQMKEKALAATDSTLDTNSRTYLANDFKSLRDQIKKIVANAEFNGTNMIKTGGVAVAALANAKDGSTRSTITVAAQSMQLGGANITVSAAATFSSVATASATLIEVNKSIAKVSTALTALGTGSKALETHLNFMTKLQDTLDAGVGNLVDADLAKESARLQALQTKQQLGIQALAIANSSSSTLLGLFR